MNTEPQRLHEAGLPPPAWKKSEPYLSERQRGSGCVVYLDIGNVF